MRPNTRWKALDEIYNFDILLATQILKDNHLLFFNLGREKNVEIVEPLNAYLNAYLVAKNRPRYSRERTV